LPCPAQSPTHARSNDEEEEQTQHRYDSDPLLTARIRRRRKNKDLARKKTDTEKKLAWHNLRKKRDIFVRSYARDICVGTQICCRKNEVLDVVARNLGIFVHELSIKKMID